MHYLVKQENFSSKIATYLLNQNLDINLCDFQGKTVNDYAKTRRSLNFLKSTLS